MLAASGRPASDLVRLGRRDEVGRVARARRVDTCLTVTTRNGHDITKEVTELAPLVNLGCPAVLDGELVAAAGRCGDFYALHPSARTTRAALTFVAFDLLWLDRHDLTQLPYDDRRGVLLDLDLPRPAVVVNTFDGTDLDVVLEACEHEGVEGVVLKHRRSTYRPGKRSDMWRKVKCPSWRQHAERRRVAR